MHSATIPSDASGPHGMGTAKRADAERNSIADAQRIVAIWNARQAGGRAPWFYPTIGAAIAAAQTVPVA
jgi:hypothetical protein